jgi:nicotinamide-nucleotide amidase
MTAEIITIGDEILIGQIIDSNSAWIAERLNQIGIAVGRIVSVSDQHEAIKIALSEASARTGLVIITGGLGPTDDDRTRTAICEYFNSGIRFDDAIYRHIESLLKGRGVEINNRNRKQAEVPDNCRVVHNPAGTAPGMWFEQNKVDYLFLPGVPFEMKAIMENVLPEWKKRYAGQVIVHRTILTQGIPESSMAKILESWEQQLPASVSLAYLPSPGILRLRLTSHGTSDKDVQDIINKEVNKVKKIIPEAIYGYYNDTLEKVVGKLLVDRKAWLATAESCTGGTIASMITSVPGSSAYFRGCLVAYANDVKTALLGVFPATIEHKGAVSQQVVESMALGIMRLMESDYSIAVSGIAGPDGGTDEKPIGLVWIAVGSPGGVRSEKFQYGEDRGRNITRASISALNMLRKEILKSEMK